MKNCFVDLECTKCGLREHRTQVVPGHGNCEAKLVLIGEAPGRSEDARGAPFVGTAGRFLDSALEDAGIRRETLFITNLVKCRPPGNRRPTNDEVSACRHQLEVELKGIEPVAVCLLGQTVVRHLLGDNSRMRDIASTEREVTLAGMKLRAFITYHPASCVYGKDKLDNLALTLRRCAEFIGEL